MMFVSVSCKKIILWFPFVVYGRELIPPCLEIVFGSGNLLYIFFGVYMLAF